MDQFVIISLLVKPIIALLTHAAHPRTVACPVFAGRLAWAREPRGHLYSLSLSLSLSLRAQFPQPLRSRVLGKLEGRKAPLLSALFVLVFFVSHFCKAHKREPKPEMLRRVLIVAAALASTEVTGSPVQQHRIVIYMSS